MSFDRSGLNWLFILARSSRDLPLTKYYHNPYNKSTTYFTKRYTYRFTRSFRFGVNPSLHKACKPIFYSVPHPSLDLHSLRSVRQKTCHRQLIFRPSLRSFGLDQGSSLRVIIKQPYINNFRLVLGKKNRTTC